VVAAKSIRCMHGGNFSNIVRIWIDEDKSVAGAARGGAESAGRCAEGMNAEGEAAGGPAPGAATPRHR